MVLVFSPTDFELFALSVGFKCDTIFRACCTQSARKLIKFLIWFVWAESWVALKVQIFVKLLFIWSISLRKLAYVDAHMWRSMKFMQKWFVVQGTKPQSMQQNTSHELSFVPFTYSMCCPNTFFNFFLSRRTTAAFAVLCTRWNFTSARWPKYFTVLPAYFLPNPIACLWSIYHVCKLIFKSAPASLIYFFFSFVSLSCEMLELATKWKLAACKSVFHTDRTVGISLWWFCFCTELKHVACVCVCAFNGAGLPPMFMKLLWNVSGAASYWSVFVFSFQYIIQHLRLHPTSSTQINNCVCINEMCCPFKTAARTFGFDYNSVL